MWIKINPTQPDNLYDLHEETNRKVFVALSEFNFCPGIPLYVIGINQKLIFLLANSDIILLLHDSFRFRMRGEWKTDCVYMPKDLG